MVESIAFSLDWLKVTFNWDGKTDPKNCVPVRSDDYEETRGIGSYTETITCRTHSISWHPDRPEQKVMLQMTGQQLSKYRTSKEAHWNLISECLKAGGNFTRLDFAVDLFDTGGCPNDVLAAWQTDQLLTSAHSVTSIETQTKTESLGQTVYIGARQSERYIRVYDKGKQAGSKLDWLRVEIEVKSKRANQFANLISRHGGIVAGKNMLLEVVMWTDVPWLNAIWEDGNEIINIDAIGRPETDRDKWLRTVVVPVVEKELNRGNEWLLGALTTLIIEAEEKGQHGPRITPSGLPK